MIDFIDTHAHPIIIKNIYKDKKNIDLTYEYMFYEFKKHNIINVICISTMPSDFEDNFLISEKFNSAYFTIGIHPCDIDKNNLEEQIDRCKKYIDLSVKENRKIVGIGEVGIDLYHDKSTEKEQIYAFKKFIEMALFYNLPLVIHTRNASNLTFEILSLYKNEPNLRGVIHCFNEDSNWAEKWTSLNFYLGIGGIITYPKNEFVREAIRKVGIEKIVYETDAPFLPPQSKRGEINSPVYINEINSFVANLYEISEEICAEKIKNNTKKLFKF